MKTGLSAEEKAVQIAEAVLEKQGGEIAILQVSELTSLADFFVICSAESEPQIRAMVDAVGGALSAQGIKPYGIEGREGSSWVLVDYSDVILHIFKKDAREFYNLDRLWGDAPKIVFPAVVTRKRAPAKKKKKG